MLHVFDVNGRELGLLAGSSGGTIRVFVPGVAEVRIFRDKLDPRPDPVGIRYYKATGCDGPAWLELQGELGLVGVVGETNEPAPRYFVGETQTAIFVETFESRLDSGGLCLDLFAQFEAVPTTEITAEDLGLPWPGPLYVGLAEAAP